MIPPSPLRVLVVGYRFWLELTPCGRFLLGFVPCAQLGLERAVFALLQEVVHFSGALVDNVLL